MSAQVPDQAEEDDADQIDNVVPSFAYRLRPLVGLGGSAGGIPALQTFFRMAPVDSGLTFVVVLHLAPERESTLAEVLQRCTSMPVVQVTSGVDLEPNTVYVIPPRLALRSVRQRLELDILPVESGRHVAVDLFFRTLADSHGPRAAAVVLSGADGDGAIGIKRIKERGGLTVAQDPGQAEHSGMPDSSIATGMVDWILPVEEIPGRLLEYFKLEQKLKLPPEEGPQPAQPLAQPPANTDEASLRDVLTFLRTRTGRDFSYYKRATILRRIGRRMQVNGIDDLPGYLGCLRTRPGEAAALLQDLLISVTNFFRDGDCFEALERQLPAMMAGRSAKDTVRVWVPACATGEEAYSIGMLLSEYAQNHEGTLPQMQIFATDLHEEAVEAAREGLYPTAIEADVSQERLRRFFVKEHHGYRVRRELREMVLFAIHDLLKDSPFSRLDLVSCRNLLIYLNRDAQKRALDIFHFALVPGGRLFLGSSESVDDGTPEYNVLDKKHRLYQQRPTPRPALPIPIGTGALMPTRVASSREGPSVAGAALAHSHPSMHHAGALREGRTSSWGELHLRLLEQLAPPSILVDAEYDRGPVIARRDVPVAAGDTAETLETRVTALEPAFFVETLQRIAQGTLKLP